jgi:large repetitive protein
VLSATTSSTAATCSSCNGSASVSVSNNQGPVTYQWSPAGGNGPNASGLCPGTYTVTVDDGYSCIPPVSQTVTVGSTGVMSSSVSSQNVSCSGGSNGSATVTVTSGTFPYTYSWSSGHTTATASGLPAGTYICTVTDANGCQQTHTVTITQPSAISPSPYVVSNVSCSGGSNGSAGVSVSGGSPGYSYSWSPYGGNGATASGLAAGTYTVFITDAAGCGTNTSITISQPSALSPSAYLISNVSCSGGSNGSAGVNVSGGSPGYSYSWSPYGGNGATASGLAAGTYTVFITDAAGCGTNTSVNVSQPSALSASASSAPVTCNGGSNGSASVSVGGGTGGYSYSWSPYGGNGSTASGLGAGTYTVTVTDANGCQTSSTASVSQPSAISLSTSSTNASCGGNNGSASVNASGGTGGYSYLWSPSGQTSATATGLPAGSHTVTVTDAAGCQSATSLTVNSNNAATVSVASTSNATCNGSSNGSASVSVSGGTPGYSYSWSPYGGSGSSASGLGAGTYTVTVTDAAGCVSSVSLSISQPSALSLSTSSTNASCGSNNGTASVNASGGTAGYSYQWLPSGQTGATATGLNAGSHTVTVTDAAGCQSVVSVTVNSNNAATITVASTANATCNGSANGSASVSVSGGTPGYTYSWAPQGGNASSASNLSAGSYTVTVTDGSGCVSSVSLSITEPGALSLSTSSTNANCGSSDGTATVSASGGTPGYSYLWSPSGQTGATATGLSAGTYSVTITDGAGCQSTASVSVTSNNAATVSVASATNITCNAGTDGSASVSVTGGTPGYTYSWAPQGGTGSSASNLPADTYTVTVTDGAGCVSSITLTLSEPSAIIPAATATGVSCFGGSDGSATVSVSGGTPGYTLLWSTGATSSTITNLPVGQYCVTITDASGCTANACVNVSQNAGLTLTAQGAAAICISQAANLTCSASGGTPGYMYNWMPGSMTGSSVTVTPTVTTTYTVTATDASGCQSAPELITVTVNPPLSVNASGAAMCAGDSTTLTANASGGDGSYTFTWLPVPVGNGPSITISPQATTTYTVVVTDACGTPSDSSAVMVTVNQPPTADFQPSIMSGCDPLAVTFTDISSSSCASQVWYFGDGNMVNSGAAANTYLLPGSYTVSMVCTDANGCIDSVAYVDLITVYPQPQAAFTVTPASPATMPVEFCVTDNSIAASSYSWSVNGTLVDTSQGWCYTPPSAGTYCFDLIVTSAGGCADTTEQCLIVFDEVSILIPNVFSPNGDGINDIFYIKNTGLKEVQCEIFDRWGLKVAGFEGVNGGWDGFSFAGVRSHDGVYFYLLRIVTATGEQKEFNGYFHLLSNN